MMGPSRKPDSSTQVVPVISPLPLKEYQPANTGSYFLPLGRIAVTPVRIGPSPVFKVPLPSIIVVKPTSTPETSVTAFNFPGSPSKGIPRFRARTSSCAQVN
jgi:hypothetical protein